MQVVKSRGFADYRVVGNIEQTIEVFNRRKVDEIIIFDIGASKDNSGVNLNILKMISRNTLMPLSYGGGISSLKDIERCLASGCDKVVINYQAINNIELLKDAVNKFGAQAIVVAIDYKLLNEKYRVYNHVTGSVLKVELFDFIDKVLSFGIGELVLTSVDADGTLSGYSVDIIDHIADTHTPVLMNGGCGSPEHMASILKKDISGCCAGSIFYYTEYGYKDIKEYLYENNCNIRQ